MQRVCLYTLLFLLAPAIAFAAGGRVALNDVIQTVEAPFKAGAGAAAIQDFESEFFQESHIASLDKIQRGRGRVMVRFAGAAARDSQVQFRWEYTEPTEQEIVSDGETLWVYLPENGQVIETDLGTVARSSNNESLTFLSGLGRLSRDFSIGFANPDQDAAGNYILDLRPKKTTSLFRQLFLVVDREAVLARVQGGMPPDSFPILSSTAVDPSGNRTLIEFRDSRVNRNLSEMLFRFDLPPGAEVVRPSGAEMGF